MKKPLLALAASLLLLGGSPYCRGETEPSLGEMLKPLVGCLSGERERFQLMANVRLSVSGAREQVSVRIVRYGDEDFDLDLVHEKYRVELRRRKDATTLALPLHRVVYVGKGEIKSDDRLSPAGCTARLISPDSLIAAQLAIVQQADASLAAPLLTRWLGLKFDAAREGWTGGDLELLSFKNGGRSIRLQTKKAAIELSIAAVTRRPPPAESSPGMRVVEVSRMKIERQLARGVRRATEIIAPVASLTSPQQQNRKCAHGELRWIGGQRVALLHGTPEQIGAAHGQLLEEEIERCLDSVLYTFGTVQTIRTGRWFEHDLQQAYARLAPHIPDDHKRECRALAQAIGADPLLLETINVFPELFHCSGFAVFGKATKDGTLYHGRVLDYMTTIGLQDSATTFVVAVDGKFPFANVGYAGFIGSVSGMNDRSISLGEMGGRGEGRWDGVPMATLMRRALEECSTLDEVMDLWKRSPRTCEYYYVFADGKTNEAVGVSADPDKIEFVFPGESHSLLGEGIEDAVVLSAGDRLTTLRERVIERHGRLDAESARWLMSRPVAMKSNLHNVLFVPKEKALYVANADHRRPAAETPYVRLDLAALLRSIVRTYPAADTLDIGEEASADARECLDGLAWPATEFDVATRPVENGPSDLLIQFPSPVKTGDAGNDRVAMEWFMAHDDKGAAIEAPAVIVVHESGSRMTVGRLVAFGLRQRGLHAFLLHLPHYGERRTGEERPDAARLMTVLRQAVADVRRARDAVAALPQIDRRHIALQGTSLGGFVAAAAGSLDGGYDSVFIMLAGGELHDLIRNGKRDTQRLRERLQQAGVDDERLKQLLNSIEPTRIAHRLDPTRTWLYSATFDAVVPIKNAEALAKAARLKAAHHIRMPADHFSGILYLPGVLDQMREQIERLTKK